MPTIGGKKIQVPELTWKEFKALLKLLGVKLFDRQDELLALAEGKGDVKEMMESMPDLVTEALAIALRETPEAIDGATISEIIEVIPEVLIVNKVKENLEKAKKIKGLLPAAPGAGPTVNLDEAKVQAEIRAKLKKDMKKHK